MIRLAAGLSSPRSFSALLRRFRTAPSDLARLWDAEHVSSPISPLVDHAEVKRRIGALSSDLLRVTEVGKSLEGREIYGRRRSAPARSSS